MLLLIDANSVYARGYFAPIEEGYEDSKHFAVYKFAQYLLSFLKDYEPSKVVLAWDGSVLARREWYPQYKVGRKPKPDDYYWQMDYAKELAKNAGFLNVEIKDREADDVIAAYTSNKFPEHALIVSGDADLLQLVDFIDAKAGPLKINSIVEVELLKWNPKDGSHRQRFATPDDVYNEYGFHPQYIPDYKGIVGDSSDNFPGVAGVGAKKAIPWLQTCGTLETIYDFLDSLPGMKLKSGKWSAAREKMYDGESMAFLCRKLAQPLSIDNTELPTPTNAPINREVHRTIKKFKEAHG